MRKQFAKRYINGIKNSNIILPKVDDLSANVFHIFPIRTSRRDELQAFLAARGVQTLVHYPIPPHKQECYREWNNLSFPITEQIHREELSLPISPVMIDEDILRVIEEVNSFK